MQVKIWVEPECAQHYVLSRFLLSRMLTVTCVPSDKVRCTPPCCCCFAPPST